MADGTKYYREKQSRASSCEAGRRHSLLPCPALLSAGNDAPSLAA